MAEMAPVQLGMFQDNFEEHLPATPEPAPVPKFKRINIAGHERGQFTIDVPDDYSEEQIKGYVNALDTEKYLGSKESDVPSPQSNTMMIKQFENSIRKGWSDDKWFAYDSLEGGTQTLGYGTKLTPEEQESGKIEIDGKSVTWKSGVTEEQANQLLISDMAEARVRAIYSLKKAGLHEDESKVAAVTSLLYNIKHTSWAKSKAKAHLEAGRIEDFMHEAFSEEDGFVKGGDNTLKGLVRRRQIEARLFATGTSGQMMSETLAQIAPVEAEEDVQRGDAITNALTMLDEDANDPAVEAALGSAQKLLDNRGNIGYNADTVEAIGRPVLGSPRSEYFSTKSKVNTKKEFEGSVLAGVIPAHMRMFVSDLMGFDDEELGINYFGKEEQVANRQVVSAAIKRFRRSDPTAKTGDIDYDLDYSTGQDNVKGSSWSVLGTPEDSIQKTLGDLTWTIRPDGHVWVTDRYNFNDGVNTTASAATKTKMFAEALDRLATGNLGLYGFIRQGIATPFGSDQTQGSTFEIDLGTESEVLGSIQ